MEIILEKNQKIIANRVKIANTFWSRLIGLWFRSSLLPLECLIIVPCKSIHTLGMRFQIDVLYLNENNEILKILTNFTPNRISPVVKKAHFIIEMESGSAHKFGIVPSDKVILIDSNIVLKL